MRNKLRNGFGLSLLLWTNVWLFTPIIAFSQAKYSNEFLTLGVGARGLGLANTQVAVCNDVTAGYWNPAGLANVEQRYQLALMHAEYFAGIAKYDYAAFSYRIDGQQAVGISLIRFGVDNILNTTQLIDGQGNVRYDLITEFSAADWGVLLSYARTFEQVKGLSFGGNVKVIRRKIGKFAGAWGFGLDAGLQYEIKKWKMGAVLKDITSTFNVWNYKLSEEMEAAFIATNNKLPENGMEYTLPRLLIGAGRDFELGKGFSLMPTLDIDMSFDGRRNELISSKAINLSPHLGIEFGYKKMVFLRTGIGNFQKETKVTLDETNKVVTCQINAGVGVCIKEVLTIDYAFCNLGNVSATIYSHIFSLKLALNGVKKK